MGREGLQALLILQGLDCHRDGGTSGSWSRSCEMIVHSALRLFPDLVI